MVSKDRTPVLIAAENGKAAVVELLTEKFRASCLERTKDGSTLLHVASLHGHPDTALMLLKKGVPLHMPNKVFTFPFLKMIDLNLIWIYYYYYYYCIIIYYYFYYLIIIIIKLL